MVIAYLLAREHASQLTRDSKRTAFTSCCMPKLTHISATPTQALIDPFMIRRSCDPWMSMALAPPGIENVAD